MSVLGTVAAGVTGFFTGWNPQAMALAYSVGSGVDSVINAPDRIGPRLEDLRVQMSQYGAMVPFEWGVNRHAGTIIWPRLLEAVEYRREESSKGGGGSDEVTYTYKMSCAVLVCEGPIAGIRRIWANKKIIYDVSVENKGETRDPAIGAIRFHLGTEDQALDPLIEATDGEGPAYRGYAYVVFEDYDVSDLGGRPPQWEFEVITDGDSDVPPTTVFGENYDLGTSTRATFGADMDPSGNIWLHTMSGHAWINPETGILEVSEGAPSKPQIQKYNGRTGALLWYYDVQPMSEDWGLPEPRIVYPVAGTGIYSGGYYFIGRGSSGIPSPSTASPYCHGLAVNCETHEVTQLVDECSSGQFQNAFYWPSVPVPVIDNNKVYLASGNGGSGGVGVGFMPASFKHADGISVTDPTPDRTGSEPLWNVPVGWRQSRAEADCPYPPSFDGTAIYLPSYAFRSQAVRNPSAVLVQGWAGSTGSYLAYIAHAPIVDGLDFSAPSEVLHCELPGNVRNPSVVWDEKNGMLWAFAGDSGGDLYAVTFGGSGPDSAGGLTPTYTGYTMPNFSNESQGQWVKGAAFDAQSGYLRLMVGGGFDNEVHMILFDPINQAVIERRITGTYISGRTGILFDIPDENKAIYMDGFYMYSVPYGATLASSTVKLGDIVADICRRAGLGSGDIDASDLVDPVDGYIVPRQMTARAAIEPLQQAFFFDAVESDDKVKFVKRGKSQATLIPIEDRAAHELGQDLPDAVTVTRAFELELPVQCDITYPDIEADHLIGNQSDRRITKDTRHNLSLQMPVVMTAEKAKAVARTLLYEAWQNQSFRFTTTRKYAHLEPTDLVELPTKAAMYRGRITAKREQPGGIIEWEAKVDSVSVYTQTGEGAVPITYPTQSIFVPTPTQLALLDIPLLRDEDDNAGFYVAMGAL